MMIVAMILTFVLRNEGKHMLKILLGIMILEIVLSLYISVNFDYGNEWMVQLNSILTGRLSAAYGAYKQYGFSIFGQPMKTIFHSSTVSFGESGAQQLVVDNSFMHLFIPSVILYLYYFVNIIWLYREHRWNALFVVFMCFLEGLTEGIVFSPYFNVGLFILAPLQFERMKSQDNAIMRIDKFRSSIEKYLSTSQKERNLR
jgi:hypothetical protein